MLRTYVQNVTTWRGALMALGGLEQEVDGCARKNSKDQRINSTLWLGGNTSGGPGPCGFARGSLFLL